MVWDVLFRKSPEPLCLQGAPSNFLVPRVKAHETTEAGHGAQPRSGKEGPRKGLLAYYLLCKFLTHRKC